ncbi:MAG: hypothetical protein WCP79_00260 [Bacillota bacterium]
MLLQPIDSFTAFCEALRAAGFSLGSHNNEGIFSLCNYFSDNLEEHSGDIEIDPWSWRIRGVTECDDMAYSKLFLNKGGWITREWYPYFLAVRREHKTFEVMQSDGLINELEYKIYDLVRDNAHMSLHDLKELAGIGKNQNTQFEKALTQQQMKMLVTISGQKFKLSQDGKEYGWPVTTFCTVEKFFGAEVLEQSCAISKRDAVDKITAQILVLNPAANAKDIKRFIGSK